MEVQVVVNVQFERAWTPNQQVRKCKKRKNPCRICAEKNEKHTRGHINIQKTKTHTTAHQQTQTHANTRKCTKTHPKASHPPCFGHRENAKTYLFLQLLHGKPSCLVILMHLALLPCRLEAKVQKYEISRV